MEHELIYTGKNVMVTVPGSGAASARGSSPSPKQTTPISVSDTTTGDIAHWGRNNTHPQDVIKDLENHAWVSSVLDWKARALNTGLVIGKVIDYKDDGSEIFKPSKPAEIPEIRDFLRKSNFNRSYMFPAARDLYTFYNIFPELIKSNDGKKIVDINVNDASWCRWKKKNDQGELTHCVINADWGHNRNAKYDIVLPVVNPFYDAASAIDEIDAPKFIYPISYPTSGKPFYSLAHWNTIRTSGALKLSNRLIAYKEAIMNNQTTVKYLIETTLAFWEWKYPGYSSFSSEQKITAHTTERDNFDKMLRGDSNAGKNIMTISPVDPVTKQSIPGIKITPLDDLVKDGKYIEDAQEMSSMMLYALSVDGTLIGNAPGKGMGAGSGSDKRVAFNNYISTCDIHVDLILEPLYTIRDFNQWDPELEFRIKRPVINTLDKGKETQIKL